MVVERRTLNWGLSSTDALVHHLERALAWAVIVTVFFLPVSEALKNITFVTSLLLYVTIVVTRWERIVTPAIAWPFLAFLGVTIVSAAVSAHPYQSLKGVWEVFRYTSFFFIVERGVREERHVRAVLWAAVTGLGITAVVTLFRHFVLGLPQWPALSLGGNNAAAEYALMGLALVFGIYVHSNPNGWRLVTLVTIACLAVIFIGIMHARMIWGALLVLGLLLGWLRSPRVALPAVAIAILIVLGVAVVKPAVMSQVLSLEDIEIYKGMGEGGVRVKLWEKAITMWRDAPWLGVGPRTFILNPDAAHDPQRARYGFSEFGQVHNLWFHTAIEMGVIGLLVLSVALGYVGYWLIRERKHFPHAWPAAVWDGAFGGWVAIMLESLVEPSFGREHAMLFLMLLALLHTNIASGAEAESVVSAALKPERATA